MGADILILNPAAGDAWARALKLKLMRFKFPPACMPPEDFSNLAMPGAGCAAPRDRKGGGG
jgi:hypothetical protein